MISKKDISIILKIGSFGVVFIIILMLFMLLVGILALTNTNYIAGTADEAYN